MQWRMFIAEEGEFRGEFRIVFGLAVDRKLALHIASMLPPCSINIIIVRRIEPCTHHLARDPWVHIVNARRNDYRACKLQATEHRMNRCSPTPCPRPRTRPCDLTAKTARTAMRCKMMTPSRIRRSLFTRTKCSCRADMARAARGS